MFTADPYAVRSRDPEPGRKVVKLTIEKEKKTDDSCSSCLSFFRLVLFFHLHIRFAACVR